MGAFGLSLVAAAVLPAAPRRFRGFGARLEGSSVRLASSLDVDFALLLDAPAAVAEEVDVRVDFSTDRGRTWRKASRAWTPAGRAGCGRSPSARAAW